MTPHAPARSLPAGWAFQCWTGAAARGHTSVWPPSCRVCLRGCIFCNRNATLKEGAQSKPLKKHSIFGRLISPWTPNGTDVAGPSMELCANTLIKTWMTMLTGGDSRRLRRFEQNYSLLRQCPQVVAGSRGWHSRLRGKQTEPREREKTEPEQTDSRSPVTPPRHPSLVHLRSSLLSTPMPLSLACFVGSVLSTATTTSADPGLTSCLIVLRLASLGSIRGRLGGQPTLHRTG